MFALPVLDHTFSSTASSDGKGGTVSSDGKGGADSPAEIGKSTKRTGPSYGAPYPENFGAISNGLVYLCSILPSIHQTRCI